MARKVSRFNAACKMQILIFQGNVDNFDRSKDIRFFSSFSPPLFLLPLSLYFCRLYEGERRTYRKIGKIGFFRFIIAFFLLCYILQLTYILFVEVFFFFIMILKSKAPRKVTNDGSVKSRYVRAERVA